MNWAKLYFSLALLLLGANEIRGATSYLSLSDTASAHGAPFTLRIEPYGPDSLRVRYGMFSIIPSH